SGFDERVHDWLPGIDEVRDPGTGDGGLGSAKPSLVAPCPTPPSANPASPHSPVPTPESPVPSPLCFTHRDREEELVAVARQIKADDLSGDAVPLARTAVVFKRPLPYLYVAGEVFGAAHIPFRASDALPLADRKS